VLSLPPPRKRKTQPQPQSRAGAQQQQQQEEDYDAENDHANEGAGDGAGDGNGAQQLAGSLPRTRVRVTVPGKWEGYEGTVVGYRGRGDIVRIALSDWDRSDMQCAARTTPPVLAIPKKDALVISHEGIDKRVYPSGPRILVGKARPVTATTVVQRRDGAWYPLSEYTPQVCDFLLELASMPMVEPEARPRFAYRDLKGSASEPRPDARKQRDGYYCQTIGCEMGAAWAAAVDPKRRAYWCTRHAPQGTVRAKSTKEVYKYVSSITRTGKRSRHASDE
jgi:hypothetical protein